MAALMVPDDIVFHPKMAEVGASAAWLFICGLCYCARYETKGYIHKWMVPRLADVWDGNIDDCVSGLVVSGLWELDGDYYFVMDWLGVEVR